MAATEINGILYKERNKYYNCILSIGRIKSIPNAVLTSDVLKEIADAKGKSIAQVLGVVFYYFHMPNFIPYQSSIMLVLVLPVSISGPVYKIFQEYQIFSNLSI